MLSGLQSRQNDRAWQLFGALKNNGMVIAGPNAQAMNPVLQGARAAVFGAVDYVALGNQAKGESVEVMFPKSGTVIAPRPMMILKSSKAQDDARKFIDYVLSPQGQAHVASSLAGFFHSGQDHCADRVTCIVAFPSATSLCSCDPGMGNEPYISMLHRVVLPPLKCRLHS
ncbi:extracellular solute-binding protein [Herbaspirillum autotrophicum]|uniref:extracellular solute-binding protein n=1 Tax=Herbaspirillum autotrophicum TaxID=180195 RepID=UPI000A556346